MFSQANINIGMDNIECRCARVIENNLVRLSSRSSCAYVVSVRIISSSNGKTTTSYVTIVDCCCSCLTFVQVQMLSVTITTKNELV